MKVTRCPEGHYYDADVYPSCPHCGGDGAKERIAAASVPGSGNPLKSPAPGGRVMGRGKAKKRRTAEESEAPGGSCVGSICEPTEILSPSEIRKLLGSNAPSEPGEREGGNAVPVSFSITPEGMSVPLSPAGGRRQTQTADVEEIVMEEKPEEQAEEVPAEEIPPAAVAPRDRRDLPPVAAATCPGGGAVCGKTLGMFGFVPSDAGNTRPLAGWLVGVAGPYFGKSFEILPGRNSVGRYLSNDIPLCMDDRVSGTKHAYVIYDPRERKFYVDAGEGSGLVYCKDRIILHHTAVERGDVIEIGGGKYCLVPLCGNEFSWNME